MYKSRKKISLIFVVFLIGVLVLANRDRGYADSGKSPQEQLQGSISEILSILQSAELKTPGKKAERKQQILHVVNRIFDFQEMARSSLGQNWNSLTPEEQQSFVNLFARLVEQRYIGKIDAYQNQEVIYKEQRVKDDKAKVYTAIIDKDLEIPIDYSLEKNKDDKWLIRDLRIENVSLVANYRRDFNSIIRKEKFSGLVAKITDQLEKSETQK